MYIDVYFLVNLILDRCSLECALRKYHVVKWRLWAGAAVGAVGACLWELACFPAVMRPFGSLSLSVVMLHVCIGRRPRSQWLKTLMELYAFSFLFAGVIPYVSRFMPLWIGAVMLSYAAIKLWLIWREKKNTALLTIQIETDLASWKVNAMVDTGHRLKDPITGSPVVIIKTECIPSGIHPSLPICFESVQGSGVMFGFWPKRLEIEDRVYKEKEILIAVAPQWKAENCEAIFPGYALD